MIDFISNTLMFLIGVLIIVIWAVVGFIFWVPLLILATAGFSAKLVHAAITGQDPNAFQGYIESATRLYPAGFRTAFLAVYGPKSALERQTELHLGLLFALCAWTAAMWLLIIGLLHPGMRAAAMAGILLIKQRVAEMGWFPAALLISVISALLISVGIVLAKYGNEKSIRICKGTIADLMAERERMQKSIFSSAWMIDALEKELAAKNKMEETLRPRYQSSSFSRSASREDSESARYKRSQG